LFLSEQYLSASTAISIYMLGDVLRVAASIAAFHALGRRRLWTYLGVETAGAALIGIFVGIGIQQGRADAPYLGYVAAYGVLFAAVCIRYVLAPRPEQGGGSHTRGRESVP
jgi:hypothetical protein